MLDPSTSWGNQDEYWQRYDALAARYIENFKLYADGCLASAWHRHSFPPRLGKPRRGVSTTTEGGTCAAPAVQRSCVADCQPTVTGYSSRKSVGKRVVV